MSGIFLNFRSADSGSYASTLLDDALGNLFGADLVFRSSRSIPAGSRFDQELLAGAQQCDVMLSLIGPEWLTASDAYGQRLLDRPDDWVRREIAIALRRDIPVIPVLLTDAQLPAKTELPADIAGLADRQAVYLRHRHIDPDLGHLLTELIRVAPTLAITGIFVPPTSLPDAFTPSMLLRPEYAVVPFSGRRAEVANLMSWITGGSPLGARLITGPAGQGKTRLALELCACLRSERWLTGILSDDSEPERIRRLTTIGIPLLLVIDYAEARTAGLLDLANTLVKRQRDTPVRLVMLARSAGEWLTDLHEHPDDRVASLFLGAAEHRLTPLARGVADRHAEFSRALQAMAYRLNYLAESVDPPPDIDSVRYERALDIHASALASLLDAAATGGEHSDLRSDPIKRVLHHERRYWRRTTAVYELPNASQARLDAVVASATLFGAATKDQAVELLGALPTFHGENHEIITRFTRWMDDLYPGPLALNPLRPDRLGEDHVASVIQNEPALATIPSAIADDSRLRQALTVLGRAAPRHSSATTALANIASATTTRFIDVAIPVATQLEDPRPLVAVLENSVASSSQPGLMDSVLAKLPESTTALAELAVMASEHALATHLRLPDRNPPITAHLLIDLSSRLRQRGRYDEALTAIIQGAEIYRQLTLGNRDAFLPNFVSAMHRLSVAFAEAGRPADALEASIAAVSGFRELAETHHEAYDAELANSLSGLSNRYKALGQRKQAVTAADEAAELYLQLWDGGQADRVMPDLARALNNLAVHLNGIGQFGQALDALDEAIDLRRRLADHNPDAFLPELASSLNNKWGLLDDLGRTAEATTAIAETVEIYRRLAQLRPEVFRSDLAMALGNYAINAAARNVPADALAASTESVDIYRSLAASRPDVYNTDLAMALNNLSTRLAQVGRLDESLQAVAESVSLRKAFLPTEEREILSGLTASLNNMGNRLRALGRRDEAVAATREAVALCRKLADQEPGYRPRLAETLNGLALAEAQHQRWADSAAAASESAAILRELHEAEPSAYRRRLASALTNYGNALRLADSALSVSLLNEARNLCVADDEDLIQAIGAILGADGPLISFSPG